MSEPTRLPKIYLFCTPLYCGTGAVQDSTPGGDVMGHAVTEDNIEIASHWCSNEDWAKHDMGYTSEQKHDIYAKLYPFGYELVWTAPDAVIASPRPTP